MKRNADMLNEMIAKWKVKINWRKTKARVVQRGGGTCHMVVDGVDAKWHHA